MESPPPEVIKRTSGTQCHALADLVVFGHRLDSTASKSFFQPSWSCDSLTDRLLSKLRAGIFPGCVRVGAPAAHGPGPEKRAGPFRPAGALDPPAKAARPAWPALPAPPSHGAAAPPGNAAPRSRHVTRRAPLPGSRALPPASARAHPAAVIRNPGARCLLCGQGRSSLEGTGDPAAAGTRRRQGPGLPLSLPLSCCALLCCALLSPVPSHPVPSRPTPPRPSSLSPAAPARWSLSRTGAEGAPSWPWRRPRVCGAEVWGWGRAGATQVGRATSEQGCAAGPGGGALPGGPGSGARGGAAEVPAGSSRRRDGSRGSPRAGRGWVRGLRAADERVAAATEVGKRNRQQCEKWIWRSCLPPAVLGRGCRVSSPGGRAGSPRGRSAWTEWNRPFSVSLSVRDLMKLLRASQIVSFWCSSFVPACS